MLKNLINLGVTFKNLDFNILELFFFKDYKKALHEIKSIKNVDGCVLIQTCNRVEIFVSCKDIMIHHNLLELFVNNFIKNVREKNANVDLNEVIKRVNIVTNVDAIKRIFRIASGLESLAVGEDEILKQVKDSVEISKEENCIDDFLYKIFDKAIKVAKKIKRKIRFDTSVTELGIEYLKRCGMELKDKKILLIGAGMVARQVLKLLSEKNDIIISNRTYEKAKYLAKKFKAKTVKFNDMYKIFNDVDIIISAIYSDRYIINKEDLKNINKNIVILDLGFPRTINPNVSEIDRVKLITISDLRNMHEELLDKKRGKIAEVERIIDEEIEVLIRKFHEYYLNDLIKDLYLGAEKQRERELKELFSYLKNLNEEDKKRIEDFSKALVKSILNPIVENLKNHATSLDKKTIEILKKIFSINH